MNIPAFDDLKCLGRTGLRVSWEVFGENDSLGTLNLLTPDAVVNARAEIVTGDRFALSVPLSQPDPPTHRRRPYKHEIVQLNRNTWDDRLHDFSLQGSSQWDGFLHVRCREFGFYGGIEDDPGAATAALGIEHWARGIIGRGVLVDLGRWGRRRYDPFGEVRISAEELSDALAAQGSSVESGDILCVRFGWMAAYKDLDPARRAELARETRLAFVGLEGSESIARLLWNWGISAIACDNPAVEASPGDPALGSLHRRLLPCLGMPMGELLDFDDLAGACAEDGRYSFMFVGVPLALPGGIGSPANAVAIR